MINDTHVNDPYHADTCILRASWKVIYVSKDEQNKTIALEILCEGHKTHWWFPPLKRFQLMQCPVCLNGINGLSNDELWLHLANHVSNLAKVARPRYECDEHPNASVYIVQNNIETKAFCDWLSPDRKTTCDKRLFPLEI